MGNATGPSSTREPEHPRHVHVARGWHAKRDGSRQEESPRRKIVQSKRLP